VRASDIQQVIFSLLSNLNIKGEAIQLTPGQIISVLLKEVQGNTALLTYQGQELLARLETEVVPGERLKCLVEGERDGQIILKLLPENHGELAGQALKDIVNRLGLTNEETNLRLATEMIKQEMPLTPDTARVLSAFTRTYSVPPKEVWIPVFMQSKGIPLTEANFNSMKNVFNGLKFLQEDMNKLLAETQKLMVNTSPGSELRSLASSIIQAIKNFQFTDTDGNEVIASKLWTVFQQLGQSPVVNTQLKAEPQPLPQQLLTQAAPTAQQTLTQAAPTAQQTLTQAAPTVQQTLTQAAPTAQQTATQQPLTQVTTTAQQTLPQAVLATEQPITQIASQNIGQIPSLVIALPDGKPAGNLQPAGQTPGNLQSAGQTSANPQPVGEQVIIVQVKTDQGSVILQQFGQAVTKTTADNPTVDKLNNKQTAPLSDKNPINTLNYDPANRENTKTNETVRKVIDRLIELVTKDSIQMEKPVKELFMSKVHSVLRETIEKSLGDNLLSMLHKLTSALTEKGSEEYSKLANLAKNMMGKMELLQNLNDKAEPLRENLMVLFSAVKFDQKDEPLRLLVNYHYDSKNRTKDFTSCRVEVKLNTPGLGMVKCEVQVNDRNLTLQFVSDNEKSAQLINKVQDSLVKRLEEMKYSVNMLPCKVDIQEVTSFQPFEGQEIPGMFQINIKV
jgi:hypothetical protein